MAHILNNPTWSALISGNSQFAEGTSSIKYFPVTVAPFVGLQELTEQATDQLYNVFPADRVAVIVTVEKVKTADHWEVIHQDMLYQMVAEQLIPAENKQEIIVLDYRHIPEMLALTKLTNPGPFLERTIEFGRYKGIVESGKLVAMAGQRLHAGQYAEISAVCTHPDYLGRGYAGTLMRKVGAEIVAHGDTPFLHVRQNNENAIKLYKKLGFVIREELEVKVIRKK